MLQSRTIHVLPLHSSTEPAAYAAWTSRTSCQTLHQRSRIIGCRRIANPLHAFKVRLLPWTQAYRDSAEHFSRLHGHWAAICASMTSEPPPAEDDVRIAAALRRIESATTGALSQDHFVEILALLILMLTAFVVPSLQCRRICDGTGAELLSACHDIV